jgi:hypothetical protein
MSAIINTLKSFDDFLSSTPASNTEILKAENALSVSFAQEYKDYLAAFGSAEAKGHELTGLIKSDRLNVVSVTNREWDLNPQVPQNLYVVENPAIDGIIIWQNADGEIFQSSPNSAPKVIASSLASYLTS